MSIRVQAAMSKVPDEDRTWERKAEEEKARPALEELRRELRRRSELARLYRSLSRDHP